MQAVTNAVPQSGLLSKSNGVVSARTPLIRLDVGSDSDKPHGWVRIDRDAAPGVDIVHDLFSFPWPIPDQSAYEIRAFRHLEHIPMLCLCCRDQVDPLLATFDEFYRLLIPGGTVMIGSPHGSNLSRAWRDPTNRRSITEETFLYANRETREKLGASHYPVQCNFDYTYDFGLNEHGERQDLRVTLVKR